MSCLNKFSLVSVLIIGVGCERDERNELDELVAQISEREQRAIDERIPRNDDLATPAPITSESAQQPMGTSATTSTEPMPPSATRTAPGTGATNQQTAPDAWSATATGQVDSVDEANEMNAEDAQTADQDTASQTAMNTGRAIDRDRDRNRDRNRNRNRTTTTPEPAPANDQEPTTTDRTSPTQR